MTGLTEEDPLSAHEELSNMNVNTVKEVAEEITDQALADGEVSFRQQEVKELDVETLVEGMRSTDDRFYFVLVLSVWLKCLI